MAKKLKCECCMYSMETGVGDRVRNQHENEHKKQCVGLASEQAFNVLRFI